MGRRRKQLSPLDGVGLAVETILDLLEHTDGYGVQPLWSMARSRTKPHMGAASAKQYVVFILLILLGTLLVRAYLKGRLLRHKLASGRLSLALSAFFVYIVCVFYLTSRIDSPSRQTKGNFRTIRNLLLQTGQAAKVTKGNPRPTLIDLGPSAMLQTVLSVLFAPVFGRTRALPSIVLPAFALFEVIASQRRMARSGRVLGGSIKFLKAVAQQILPGAVAAYILLHKKVFTGPQPQESARLHNSPIEKVIEKDPDHHVPVICLKYECAQCFRHKQRLYDSYGYPIYEA